MDFISQMCHLLEQKDDLWNLRLPTKFFSQNL